MREVSIAVLRRRAAQVRECLPGTRERDHFILTGETRGDRAQTTGAPNQGRHRPLEDELELFHDLQPEGWKLDRDGAYDGEEGDGEDGTPAWADRGHEPGWKLGTLMEDWEEEEDGSDAENEAASGIPGGERARSGSGEREPDAREQARIQADIINLLESGQRTAAEGAVHANHMERGYELEREALAARASFGSVRRQRGESGEGEARG